MNVALFTGINRFSVKMCGKHFTFVDFKRSCRNFLYIGKISIKRHVYVIYYYHFNHSVTASAAHIALDHAH